MGEVLENRGRVSWLAARVGMMADHAQVEDHEETNVCAQSVNQNFY